MKSKKVIEVLMSFVLMVVLLAGCGRQASTTRMQTSISTSDRTTSSAAADQSNHNPVTVRIWGDALNQTVIQKPFQEINDAFMKKYPNIKIQFDISQTNDTLQVALQTNSLPDAFMVQGNKTPMMAVMANNGRILPLDGKIDGLDRYDQSEIDYCKVNGKMYCSPASFLDTSLVYYNKDIFQKNNLSVPKTWDEFLALNDKLLAEGITPISYTASTDWDNLWPLMVLAPDFANDALANITQDKGTWKDPALATAFNNFKLLAEKGYFGKNYVGVNEQGWQLAFTNQKAAMIIDGTWNYSLYAKSGIKLGMFFIPNDKGETIASLSLCNFLTYAVASNTKYPKEVEQYVNFLSTREAQQIMENDTAMPVLLKDIKPASDAVKEMSSFKKLGWNVIQVATFCASDESKPNDILLKQIVPQLITMKITGEQASDILDKASTYLKN